MYKDKKLFIEKLIELIPKSIDYKLELYKDQEKEYNMLNRLEFFCKNKGWDFKRNDTNGNTIDCFINNKSFQAKYCSLNTYDNIYNINLMKSLGMYSQPYDFDDFDYLIIEIGGIKNSSNLNDLIKYHNYFCIISKYELIKQEALKTDICKGKTSLSICSPDYIEEYWNKSFWYR